MAIGAQPGITLQLGPEAVQSLAAAAEAYVRRPAPFAKLAMVDGSQIELCVRSGTTVRVSIIRNSLMPPEGRALMDAIRRAAAGAQPTDAQASTIEDAADLLLGTDFPDEEGELLSDTPPKVIVNDDPARLVELLERNRPRWLSESEAWFLRGVLIRLAPASTQPACASDSDRYEGSPGTQPALRLDLQSGLHDAGRPEIGEHMWGRYRKEMVEREARMAVLAGMIAKAERGSLPCLAVDILWVKWTGLSQHGLTVILPRGAGDAAPEGQPDSLRANRIGEKQWQYLSRVAAEVSARQPPAVLTEEANWAVIVTYYDGTKWRRTTWINMREEFEERDVDSFNRLMTLVNHIDHRALPPGTSLLDKVIAEYEALSKMPTTVPAIR